MFFWKMSTVLSGMYQHKSGHTKKLSSKNLWRWEGAFLLPRVELTPQPQVTLVAGSFALFNVSLKVHTLGYWYQQSVNICSSHAGQKGCRLHWLHTTSFTPLQSRKMSQPWLQKVTRMIAPVDLNHTCAHDYLSKGCMRDVGNVLRNKWYFLVMCCNH